MHEPEDHKQLIQLLRSSFEHNLLDSNKLSIIKNMLQISEIQTRNIIIPHAQINIIDINESPDKFIPLVIQTGHSHFPMIENSKNHMISILLTKDLLRYYANEEDLNMHNMLQPAIFIPESKRLNVLLKDFRANHNHMAIVVDEYGDVTGLVTIESVIEQIVDNIKNEYDFDETADDIIADKSGTWHVKTMTKITKFNKIFNTAFSNKDNNTINNLILTRINRIPKHNEQLSFDSLNFKVLHADNHRLHLLLVEKKAGAK